MAALPYIQLYIADYLADTAHLTTEEHGAYLLLIFNYWQTGKPLPVDRLARIVKLSDPRWSEVEMVLKDFFEQSECKMFWRHVRIERDLRAVRNMVKKNARAGIASGKARRNKRLGAERPLNERSTNVERPLNDKGPLNERDTDTDTDTDTEREKRAGAREGQNPEDQEAEDERQRREIIGDDLFPDRQSLLEQRQPPVTGRAPTPEEDWRMRVSMEPWAQAIKRAGGKIGPGNWVQFDEMVKRFELEPVLKATKATPAASRWPDAIEETIQRTDQSAVARSNGRKVVIFPHQGPRSKPLEIRRITT